MRRRTRLSPVHCAALGGSLCALLACTPASPPDGGSQDAGAPVDGGAGALDAGRDAGAVDAGAVDAGPEDAGTHDAGPVRRVDAGWPSGDLACVGSGAAWTSAALPNQQQFGGAWPVSDRLVTLTRAAGWRVAAFSALTADAGFGLSLRAWRLDGGEVLEAALATSAPVEHVAAVSSDVTVVAAWTTATRVQAATWALAAGSTPQLAVSVIDVAPRSVNVVPQADGGFTLLWSGARADGGVVLKRLAATADAGAVELGLTSTFVHVASVGTGFVAATSGGAAWLDERLEVVRTVALPPGLAAGGRVAVDPRAGRVALAALSGGRRPTVTVAELWPDGGVAVLFERQDTSYSTTSERHSVDLAPCGRGFVVAWRDDSTHARSFPVCSDSEYCLTNDLRVAAVTTADAGAAEWLLTPSGRWETERALSPALALSEDGGALDVAWARQPVADVREGLGPVVVVVEPERLRCDCAAP